jgi:hypothetical protein
MKAQITSSDRTLIIRILERELGTTAVYAPLPSFSYTIGGCTLLRDGSIRTQTEDPAAKDAILVLASLGLCDYPYTAPEPAASPFVYPMAGMSAQMLINLMCIISSRQDLLNRALDAKGAFFASRALMEVILSHPPQTTAAFLQRLYGHEDDYRGVRFDLGHVALSAFDACPSNERQLHEQLAERIMHAARGHLWMKPFTNNVRNKKYALRSWLNAIGMQGPEYEESRRIMLSRAYGRSDYRPIPRNKEK